jgi:hypothetical protein
MLQLIFVLLILVEFVTVELLQTVPISVLFVTMQFVFVLLMTME